MKTIMNRTAAAMIMYMGLTSMVAATTPTDAAIPTASTTTPTDVINTFTSLTPLTPAQKAALAKENAQDAATGVPSINGYKTH